MASKKYKNKTCAYCGKPGASQSGDHIFAREFFLERQRPHLPQVPACTSCNNTKSQLETYLLQLMPLGANHPDAHEAIRTLMPKRARNRGNKALHRALESTDVAVTVIDHEGQTTRRTPASISASKLEDWCGLVARGLAFYHWEVATPDYKVDVRPLNAAVEQGILAHVSGVDAKWRVKETVGEGAFRYHGVKCADDESASIWMIDLYGRMPIGGAPSVSPTYAATWAVFIRPA